MTTTSTDPIADMLSRIRNAIAVQKHEIVLPHSKVKEGVAKILKQNNFLDDVRVSDGVVGKLLTIIINSPMQNSRITEISRISTPGLRQYGASSSMPTVKHGRGMVIVSTSSGLMTGTEAKQKGIGGELICKVY